MWVVGNHKKFNREGVVPTNITYRDVLRSSDENNWNTGEAIALLASMAGLFHDFGKANLLFQKKLKGKTKKNYEPFRHEWISLLLFRSFVGDLSDKAWLEKLSKVCKADDKELIEQVPKSYTDLKKNPLKGLPKIAKFIGWLILSHHKLPISLKKDPNSEPPLDNISNWMDGKYFNALWNSPQCDKEFKEDEKSIIDVINFKIGTPFQSKKWCFRANKYALRALKYFEILNQDWFKDRFTMHLARLSLMLADHIYSGKEPALSYQDSGYKAYANTDRTTKAMKQKLDEHNIQVSHYALNIAKSLPELQDTLPVISTEKEFKKRISDPKFAWQNQAYDLATSLKKESHDCGFFGVNLASTGCGKTFANAKIMFGLSDEKNGCRFSIALGLRVLTLQTGEALTKRLKITNDDLAVLIGSQAFKELYDDKNEKNDEAETIHAATGSESLDSLVDDEEYVSYEGSLDDGKFSQILNSSPKAHKILSAPILVCTIDHLISANESKKGGKQIAPILRLLTSDLVLDEPDEFDVADLPALCRLVNFAGVFGSRVLLSSATLPPAIVNALFDAYAHGRNEFNKSRRKNVSSEICCAWFDEFGVKSNNHASAESFMETHDEFVTKRCLKLDQQPILRRGTLIPVQANENIVAAYASTINDSVYKLHDIHHQVHSVTGKRISIGLIRMAHINPMVAVAKEMLLKNAKENYCIHFLVYHSRFTMIVRSKIEELLDRVLSRHNPDLIWELPEVKSALAKSDASNHIFVVFATSVAEVGRDHDYDWAVVEPSSMRSIIQLAGRVQRHRQVPTNSANLLILQKNIRGLNLNDSNLAFDKPGFESKNYNLASKDLSVVLKSDQYEIITAKTRLIVSKEPNHHSNLVDLEHVRLKAELLGNGKKACSANSWWHSSPDWTAELQRLSPFRKPDGIDKEYIAYLEEEGESPVMHEWPKYGQLIPVENKDFKKEGFKAAEGNFPWINCSLSSEIAKLALKKQSTLRDTSLKFARVSLKELTNGEKWMMNPIFGFYRII